MTAPQKPELLNPCTEEDLNRISNFQLWYSIIVRKDDSRYVLLHDGKIHNINNGIVMGRDYIPLLVFNTPTTLGDVYVTQSVTQEEAERVIFCMHRHGITSRDPVIQHLMARQAQLFNMIIELQQLNLRHAKMQPGTAERKKVGERHDMLLNLIAEQKFNFITECNLVDCCDGYKHAG